jgi:hypothetical protein
MNSLKFRALKADEIDVRVQQINTYRITVLLYKDARVDQNILDETVGCLNWQKAYSRDNSNCTVSIWDSEKSQWISKEDTVTESNTEKEKGLASDSFKRACFCWGIGRELYTTPVIQIPTEFADIKDNNGRKTTYDKFFVRDLEVTESETGAKSITKIGIGIEHRGQKDWVYAWSAEKGEKTHKPSWIK